MVYIHDGLQTGWFTDRMVHRQDSLPKGWFTDRMVHKQDGSYIYIYIYIYIYLNNIIGLVFNNTVPLV